MSAGRIVAVVFGVVIGLIAMGLLVAGTFLTIAYAVTTEDDGYFDTSPRRFGTPTAAITTEEADLTPEPDTPAWIWDFIDLTVRFSIEESDGEVFLGIAQGSDVDVYLGATAHDQVREVRPGDPVRYRTIPGGVEVEPPADQDFWVAETSGFGAQELVWEVTEGRWVVVLMNADGSPGVVADVAIGAKSGVVLPVGISMLGFGLLLFVIAVVIIVLAAVVGRGGEPLPARAPRAASAEPVWVNASIDEPLSQWLWLVKWFLAIPHFFVLFFLWIAFAFVTFIAWWAILFTARYPEGLFKFNVGVIRWTWRVMCYAGPGGLGTDRYPPFTLDDVPDYPARFDVVYPERLSRGLIFVKWWLLAIPHYLIVALFVGGTYAWAGDRYWTGPAAAGGLIGVLVLIAAVILLFTRRYPQSLFDLIIGLNRWVLRVEAYVLFFTDQYPPFRLDQGGSEPEPAADTTTV